MRSLSRTAIEALAAGASYVNVHTAKNRAGEIRGQLARGALVVAADLTAAAEVPKPRGAASARGRLTGKVQVRGDAVTLRWRLTAAGLTGQAVAAHLHRGAPGKAGPVLASLCGPCRSGATGSTALSDAALAAIHAGQAYVNVHTARNQAGEVRGQAVLGP